MGTGSYGFLFREGNAVPTLIMTLFLQFFIVTHWKKNRISSPYPKKVSTQI